MNAQRLATLGACIALFSSARLSAQQNPAGLARPHTAAVGDRQVPLPPSTVRLTGGLLAERFQVSETQRLLRVDEHELLDGYEHRPGHHPWVGEHVGKWLHAATLSWASTRSKALRTKIDRVAARLVATQEPNGYLGTYAPDVRFGLYNGADWDVWSHKYNLLGLLTYYQYTGNRPALDACRKMGDLLIATFGPGKKSILSAGTHMGMAATSVLEPMTLLYRATGDHRYLDFCEYLVRAWDEPGGPRILHALLAGTPVNRVANGKAYEMLSNLVGLCELYRATGRPDYIRAVLSAWRDIVAHRLYITGSGSSFEVWQPDGRLPNGVDAHICETCVTVTWEQLNVQLLRLTGDAGYADQIERTVYNHLLGAQKETGEAWAYYTPLDGRKPYSPEQTCCLSSGPRGLALAPDLVFGRTDQGVAVNLFASAEANVPIPGSGSIRIVQTTGYPLRGAATLKIAPARPTTFALDIRVPAYAPGLTAAVNGTPLGPARRVNGYLRISRRWRAGDTVTVRIPLAARVVLGTGTNAGREAILYGPLVLAADAGPSGARRMVPASTTVAGIHLTAPPSGAPVKRPVFQIDARSTTSHAARATLLPYYAAGQRAGNVRVWFPRPDRQRAGASLLEGGSESCSRTGNVADSIADGAADTFRVTFDNRPADEDWYAVTLSSAVTIRRIVFIHGHTFHDGGWFDASEGAPRVQIRETPGGPWLDLGPLPGYPATTAASPGALADGQAFELRIAPRRACAVRVVGKPAHGDNAAQAFSSCAELQAF